MNKREILVLDDGDGAARSLDVLLRQADFQLFRATSGAEAICWVVSRKKTGNPFELFLVSRTPSSFPLSRIIAQIWGAGASLPILVVRRPETAEYDLSALPGLQTCRPHRRGHGGKRVAGAFALTGGGGSRGLAAC